VRTRLRSIANPRIIEDQQESSRVDASNGAARHVVETILVIEDCAPSMALTVAILSQAGYQVIQADSAERGLEMAFEAVPDVILMASACR
jgi:response regulator RpfG family c-di-GMP phosphodiesterase